jgi:hypothetical protein
MQAYHQPFNAQAYMANASNGAAAAAAAAAYYQQHHTHHNNNYAVIQSQYSLGEAGPIVNNHTQMYNNQQVSEI